MKVLFQKPGWATATFRVSASARSAVTVAIKPMSRANVLFMTCPHVHWRIRKCTAAIPQSSLMFFSRTTRPQRASSSLKNLPNSALDVGAGVAPD